MCYSQRNSSARPPRGFSSKALNQVQKPDTPVHTHTLSKTNFEFSTTRVRCVSQYSSRSSRRRKLRVVVKDTLKKTKKRLTPALVAFTSTFEDIWRAPFFLASRCRGRATWPKNPTRHGIDLRFVTRRRNDGTLFQRPKTDFGQFQRHARTLWLSSTRSIVQSATPRHPISNGDCRRPKRWKIAAGFTIHRLRATLRPENSNGFYDPKGLFIIPKGEGPTTGTCDLRFVKNAQNSANSGAFQGLLESSNF